jgi:hypothetical protein
VAVVNPGEAGEALLFRGQPKIVAVIRRAGHTPRVPGVDNGGLGFGPLARFEGGVSGGGQPILFVELGVRVARVVVEEPLGERLGNQPVEPPGRARLARGHARRPFRAHLMLLMGGLVEDTAAVRPCKR